MLEFCGRSGVAGAGHQLLFYACINGLIEICNDRLSETGLQKYLTFMNKMIDLSKTALYNNR